MSIQGTPALLLVGGMGTRLHSVAPATPKPLASVTNKSFLQLLAQQLKCQGIRHLAMRTGYLAEQMESEFGGGSGLDDEIKYSNEMHPLGTAGAVRLRERHLVEVSEFLLMDCNSMLEFSIRKGVKTR